MGSDEEVTSLFYALKEPHEVLERQQEELRTRRAAEDWKESIEKWIDWMDAIGRTNDTLRTRWYQIVRFSKAVDKSITDVTEDDLIFYLAGMGTEGRRGVRSCVKVFYQWSMKPSTSEHRSMYSYVRLSIDRCTATYV